MPSASTSRRRTLLHLALLAAVVVGCYAGTLHAPFQFDDGAQIVDNPCGEDLACYLAGSGGVAQARRVGYLSIWLNRRTGGLDVLGFHLLNVAVHLLASLAVYGLGRTLLRAADRDGRLPEGAVAGSALLGALVFAAHPLQTQAVTYLVQRFTSIATLFYALALLLHVRGRLRPRFDGGAAAHLAGAVACALLAMSTKEIAFTLPLAVLVVDLAFLPGPGFRRWATLAPLLATLPVVPLARLDLRAPVAEVVATAARVTQVQTRVSRWDYLATEWRAVVGYLRMIVVPAGQSIDHDFRLSRWPWDGPTWAAGLALSALLVAGILLLRRRRPPEVRVAGYGILLFFLALSVESTVVPILDVFVEHRLYLPMVGVALVVTGGGLHAWIRSAPGMRRPLVLAAGGWVLVLGAATIARNQVWLDPVTLWADAVARSPARHRARFNLGNALRDAGDLEGARREWEETARLAPFHSGSWTQLGNLAALEGDGARAEACWRRAIDADPGNGPALHNLAGLLEARGELGEARALQRRFVEVAPRWLAAEAAEVRRRNGWPPSGPVPP